MAERTGGAEGNAWCEVLGIEVPRLQAVAGHREANTYALLLVTLLEHGGPMTLQQVAERFEQAGIATAERALRSLQRCKPGRAPVYRDGELYHLDPYDRELSLWVFRLGLRPPRVPRLQLVRPEPETLPGPEVPLKVEELDEAFRNANLASWSQQRLVLAVLDAHGEAMRPAEVVSFVAQRTRWHVLCEDAPSFRRRNSAGRPSAVEVRPDGSWAIKAASTQMVRAAREAVRARLETERRYGSRRADPAVVEASRKAAERRRAAHAAELAKLRRGLLYAFPATAPQAVALLDVQQRQVTIFTSDELPALHLRLEALDLIGAIDVRGLLRGLGFDPGQRRLAELGPPQKTMQFGPSGRTLKITTELLVKGSCGISRPFGAPDQLARYLAQGQHTKLRRRLETDIASLFALYQYGRLHGVVRLRWGPIDERLPVPWVHWDEPTLHDLMNTAAEAGVPLEVVVGRAPDLDEPWARALPAHVLVDDRGSPRILVDQYGEWIDRASVQLARLPSASG